MQPFGPQTTATFSTFETVEGGASYEPPYKSGLKYVGFVDPSGGSADSFTLAVAHRDAESLILDAIREVKPPFSP